MADRTDAYRGCLLGLAVGDAMGMPVDEMTWDEIREKTVSFMKERHYELESESPEKVTFRLKGVAGKLSKMYEDRLTFINGPEGWTVEGLRKDVMRITSGLEHLMDS